MSYEGVDEWITKKGFYLVTDCYEDKPVLEDPEDCLEWHHSVDFTNGLEEGSDYADHAKKEMIGHLDVWHEDHHGNKYATKKLYFRPVGKNWKKVK